MQCSVITSPLGRTSVEADDMQQECKMKVKRGAHTTAVCNALLLAVIAIALHGPAIDATS
jgi:hypothetical protein